MRVHAVSLVLALAGALHPDCARTPEEPEPVTSRPAAASRAAPALRVVRVVKGLEHPWDVQRLPDGRLLVGERDSRRLLTYSAGRLRSLAWNRGSVWVSGETGLMSMAIDPGFRSNRRFYVCHGGFTATGHDVRVSAFRLSGDSRSATRVSVLLRGIPARSGRHGGCRLLIAKGGALLVGTGDAAVGTNPQNLDAMAGKVLRLNRLTGRPWPTNPYIDSSNPRRRYVLTHGHRNVQGLSQRRDGTVWSVEHGPDRDDEVNRVRVGGDYGWHPVPGYNESVPMTDHSLPGTQLAARWRSGEPTLATSGAAWVYGERWGSLAGTLAVACLKGSRLLFIRFDADGRVVSLRAPAAMQQYGRLRSVTRAANGDLLVTTANGTGDAVLRVSPVP